MEAYANGTLHRFNRGARFLDAARIPATNQKGQRLQLPMIAGGIGHGSGAHAPNEYMVIEPRASSGIADLAQVERFYVDLLYALAEADSPR